MTKFEEIAQGYFSPSDNAEIDSLIVYDTGVAFEDNMAGQSQAANYAREMKAVKAISKRIITREQVEKAILALEKPEPENGNAEPNAKDAAGKGKKPKGEPE